MNQTLTKVQMKVAVKEEVKVFKLDKYSIAERVLLALHIHTLDYFLLH